MNTPRSDVSSVHSGSRDPLIEFKHLSGDTGENSDLQEALSQYYANNLILVIYFMKII